jgi:tetratricopeptide (TPR) repeat protein
LTRTLNEIARVERGRGNPDHAAELLRESIALLKDGDTPILAWAERELGTVYASSDALLAEKHLRTAAELFDRTDEPLEAAITYRVLGDVLRGSGRPDAAFDAYRDGISRIEAEPVA